MYIIQASNTQEVHFNCFFVVFCSTYNINKVLYKHEVLP